MTDKINDGSGLRAYFAGKALVAIGNWCPDRADGGHVNWENLGEIASLRAEFAVQQADALIAELSKGGAK